MYIVVLRICSSKADPESYLAERILMQQNLCHRKGSKADLNHIISYNHINSPSSLLTPSENFKSGNG
jgi:hypothetical protein